MTTHDLAVAFIGLGHMGIPMASNLAKAGITVRGFDVSEDACTAATDNGVPSSTDLATALEKASVVWTMLPNGQLVSETLSKAMDICPEGTLFIDSSTIAVADAQNLGKETARRGYFFIDAPVSGGVVGAAAGTLAFMVGGGEDALQRAHPLLDILGATIIHCGPVGSGQAVKICNNLILGVHQIVVAESLTLAGKLGIDPSVFLQVVANSTGACWALTKNCPVPGPVPEAPSNNDYKPGYAGALMLKDLRLAAEAIEQTKTQSPMGLQALRMYEEFLALDSANAGKDFSAIIHMLNDEEAGTP